MLTLSGTVRLQDGAGDDALVPALAFEGPGGRWRVAETYVDGEFPASFTLRVYTPPPEEVMLDLSPLGLDEPRFAGAYITAAEPEHETAFDNPNSTSVYTDCSGLGPCTRVRRDACLIDEARAESHDGFDPSYCYAEIRDCGREVDYEALEVSARECPLVETLGDPALAVRPEERFSGFAQRYRVFYLEGELLPGTATARLFGFTERLARGYHVVEERLRSEEQQEEARRCTDEAQELGIARYLADHPELDCELVPRTEGSAPYVDCADPDTELQLAPELLRAQNELDCPPAGDRVFVPVDSTLEPLEIEVGAELPDFGFGSR